MFKKSPLTIVIINDLSWAKGGASGLAIQNAKLMAEAGVQVVFISADGKTNADLEKLGVQCVAIQGESINPNQPMGGLVTGLHNKNAHTFLKQWIQHHDSANTVYHVHGWSKILSPAVFLALKPVANRLVIHGHDYFPVCPNGAFIHYKNNADCQLKPCGMRCLASNCDQRSYTHKVWRFMRGTLRNFWVDFSKTKTKLVLLHASMRPFYLRGDFTDDNLLVMPNPVSPYVKERVLAEKNRQFVFIGRVVPEKGADVFLAAAKLAGVPAKVIGDGAFLATLKSQYPEVEFVGWQSNAEMVTHINQARAVVMPSKLRETFGLVAVESIASGLPVIVSEHSALAADIVNLGVGTAIKSEDVAQLSVLLKQFSDSDALIATMSQKGFAEWHRLALTPEEWRDRLLSLYNSLLE